MNRISIILLAIATSVNFSGIARNSDPTSDSEQKLEVALPYAIPAILEKGVMLECPFSEIEANDVKKLRHDATVLKEADNRLDSLSKACDQTLEILSTISAIRSYVENSPYSSERQQIFQSRLDSISIAGTLTEQQSAEISDLKDYLDRYYYALLRFDDVINSVNEAISELREIPDSEQLAISEIEATLNNKAKHIEYISRYPWLYQQYEQYSSEVTRDPYAGPHDTETTIASLVNETIETSE